MQNPHSLLGLVPDITDMFQSLEASMENVVSESKFLMCNIIVIVYKYIFS